MKKREQVRCERCGVLMVKPLIPPTRGYYLCFSCQKAEIFQAARETAR